MKHEHKFTSAQTVDFMAKAAEKEIIQNLVLQKYSGFQLCLNLSCCACNLKNLRMQSRRLHTCRCSPHVYMNCAIARVLVH